MVTPDKSADRAAALRAAIDAIDIAFGAYEDAVENAQRQYHNYQEWGEEQWDSIQAARNAVFAATQKARSLT